MNPFKVAGVVLLHGVGLGLAIMEDVARPNSREPELPAVEKDEDDGFWTEDEIGPPFADVEEREAEAQPLFPDTLASMDLSRPQLGSHQSHANMLMEQAAALGALKNGLQLSGFDADEAWVLVRMYARLWWSAMHEREMEFDEDDD